MIILLKWNYIQIIDLDSIFGLFVTICKFVQIGQVLYCSLLIRLMQ